MIQQLKITFFHYLYKTNSKGEAPIYCRIAIANKKLQFSTGIYTTPNKWDKDSQRARGIDENAMLINRKLQEVYSQLVKIEKRVYDEGEGITLSIIYDRYKGKQTNYMLCRIFDERISAMEKLVGIEYTSATLQKFREVYSHVTGFLYSAYHTQDIPVKHLNYAFIKQYQEYLAYKGLKPITINKIIQRLRQMIAFAIRCGYIQSDPFVEYRPLKEKKQLVFLSQEELAELENYHFNQERLEEVKYLYLFSVYTGLAYNEAHTLQQKHIIKGFDGKNWINITRRKTDKEVSIPLLPQAEAILNKFKSAQGKKTEFLLPRISNQKVNSYLKEISEIVGIDKKLTHHTARKTFATTILLYNDVPIEIVSALLGHSDISITQKCYAKVVNRSISRHMEKLEAKIK